MASTPEISNPTWSSTKKYRFDPRLEPVVPDGLGCESAPLEGADGSDPDVIPSAVLAGLDALADDGGLQDGVLDVDESVVVVDGLLPSEVVEDVLLAEGVVQVVLTADDVGHAHLVVVDRDGQVHHRVDVVLVPGPRVGVVHDAQCDEVPDGGVGVVEVGLHDDDGLALLVLAGEELVVPLELGLDGEVVAGAGLTVLLELPPVVPVAGAHVCVALLQELPGVVVVDLEPVGLVERPADADAEPVEVLDDHVVGVGPEPLGVGVLEPEDELPSVPLDVLVVEDGGPGVSDVQGAGGSGRDAHGDLPGDSLEIRQLVVALLLLLHEEGRVDGLEGLDLGIRRHGVDLGDNLVDDLPDLGGPGAEFGDLAQHLADNGLRIGLALEEYSIL